MRILCIGNSFSVDASQFLHQIAESADYPLDVLNLHIPGCSLEHHMETLRSGEAAYAVQLNGQWPGSMSTAADALRKGPWDVVTLQQASHDSGLIETYLPHGVELAAFVRDRAPEAALWIQQTWAYETDSTHEQFPRYQNSQALMYSALTEAYSEFSRRVAAPLIRSAELIQLLRQDPLFDYAAGAPSLNRDGFHLSLDYGRYAVALLWFLTLTGAPLESCAFLPPAAAEQRCAQLAAEIAAGTAEEGAAVELAALRGCEPDPLMAERYALIRAAAAGLAGQTREALGLD